MTPFSIPTSILVVGVVCTLYTSIVSQSEEVIREDLKRIAIVSKGGIKAVIWTDVLQCILMFLGVVMVIIQARLVWRWNQSEFILTEGLH